MTWQPTDLILIVIGVVCVAVAAWGYFRSPKADE